jgi:hypothetical protein
MQQSVLADRGMGIAKGYDWSGFADVRQKAKEEIEERRKWNRKKKKQKAMPKHKIGDLVVVKRDYTGNDYLLVEVIDFLERWKHFEYFGIIRNIDFRHTEERIGRLCNFSDGWDGTYREVLNVTPEDFKWKVINMEDRRKAE